MFSKKDDKLETIIGDKTQIDGNVTTKGTIKIDGRINGNIDADWVIMEAQSYLKGNINASGVVIAGYVEGNIAAKEVVEIKSTGQVRGDISTTKLVVLEGGFVEGQVSMQKDASKNSEPKAVA